MTTLLTDEVRAAIGREVTYEAPEAYGAASFRYFAVAVGDDEPIYRDPDAARAAGLDDVTAPPTFVCETNQYMTGRPDDEGYLGHGWDLPVTGCRLIRGGHSYELGRPLRPDDRPVVTWRIADAAETTSGDGAAMLIVTSVAEHRAQDGELLARNTETLIYLERR